MLNMADPTMVPMPMLLASPKASASDVKSSGALEPAARNVAPATSGERCSAYRNEASAKEGVLVSAEKRREIKEYVQLP
jgi:hypothetical protein